MEINYKLPKTIFMITAESIQLAATTIRSELLATRQRNLSFRMVFCIMSPSEASGSGLLSQNNKGR